MDKVDNFLSNGDSWVHIYVLYSMSVPKKKKKNLITPFIILMALDSKLLMNVIPVLCRLQDVAGYGVAVATTKIFGLDFPDRTFESPLLGLLMKTGRNGSYIIFSFVFLYKIISSINHSYI